VGVGLRRGRQRPPQGGGRERRAARSGGGRHAHPRPRGGPAHRRGAGGPPPRAPRPAPPSFRRAVPAGGGRRGGGRSPGGWCGGMREWTRVDKSAPGRVDDLKNGGGLNGGVVLNATTLASDNDADVLTGSSGYDWFLFDPEHDRVTDLHDEAFTNDLPFISG